MTPQTRLAAPIAFATVVLATLAAFLVVERERRHPTLIDHDHATLRFLPGAPANGDPPGIARARFRVTDPDRNASVVIVDDKGAIVRTLQAPSPFADDSKHRYSWDGSVASGGAAPPGNYRFEVRLGDHGKDLPIKITELLSSPDGG